MENDLFNAANSEANMPHNYVRDNKMEKHYDGVCFMN